MTVEGEEFDKLRPSGKSHYLTVALCFFLGNCMLFPWNALLTVEDYFYNIFPDYHPSRVFTLIYEPFAFVTTLIFLFYEAKANTRHRVLCGFSVFVLVTAVIIVLDLGTSGKGGIGTYAVMCILIAAWGIGDGTSQGGLVGDLSFMSPIYIQAYNAGLAASGVATSALRMITKAGYGDGSKDLRKGALTFFGIAAVVEIVGIFLYAFVFPRMGPVKAYRLHASQQGALTVTADLAAAGVGGQPKDSEYGTTRRLSTWQLCKESWDYLLAVVFIYVLTLSIFPGFLYEDTGVHKLGSWYALVLIGLYNLADLTGRYIPVIPGLFLNSRRGILLACLARVAFIPCFYYTAKYAAAGYMMFLCICLGLTNGYLTVCVFVKAVQGYTGPEQNALGNALVLFLILGLFLGVASGWLWLIGHGW